MSARLYAHVPARSEAYSSRYRRRERFALVVTLSSLDLQSQIAFSHVVHNQLRTINEPEPWKIYLLLKDLARANRVSPHRTATQTDSRQTGRGDTVRPALPDTSLGFRCQGRVTTEDHHNKRSLTFVRDDTFLIFVISSGARNLSCNQKPPRQIYHSSLMQTCSPRSSAGRTVKGGPPRGSTHSPV